MSIKVDMTANDLDKQIDLLKHFPDMIDPHYRPVVVGNVSALSSNILSRVPYGVTGRAHDTFKSKVTGKGMYLSGKVGWFSKGDPGYVNVLEHGAKAHVITPRKQFSNAQYKAGKQKLASRLRWMDGGEWVFARSVNHPGLSAMGFMAAGFSAVQPQLTAELAAANDAILKDLAVR